MRYFIISDTHFGHENIIRYCNRPFRSVDEMNKAIIKRWNESVSNEDIIIHLGDFFLGSKEECKLIAKQLHGRRILIKGNHDNMFAHALHSKRRKYMDSDILRG